MPYICAVSGCFNQRGKNSADAEGKPINYFAFPSPIAEKERYDKFSELCRLQQDCDGLRLRICSSHFCDADITGNRFLKPALKKCALPCRNLPEVRDRENVETHQLRPVQPDSDCSEFFAADADLTLTKIINSVVLPPGVWCSRLCDDCVAFFELVVDTSYKPVIIRSVTIDFQLHPTVYVGGSLISLDRQSPLCSIDDVNSLLVMVSSLSPDKSSNVNKISDLISEAIAAHEHVNCVQDVSTDHSYSGSVNVTDTSHQDHTYADSAEDCVAHEDTILYLSTLKFLRSQCHILSATTASRRRYEPAFVRWCLLIYFHSPAAYRAILQTKCLVLPSERLLRQYSAPYRVQPGLQDTRQQYLSSAADRMTSLEKNVSLIVDEMYIKPEISYSSGKLGGFADNRPDAVAATTILTLMVQSLCGSFRDVVAFFPVCHLTGAEEAKYVRDTIVLIEKSGLNTQCVVCDNSKVNQTMLREFGVAVNDGVLTGVASHPIQHDRKLFFIIDPCHLIKCIRNNWLNRSTFLIAGENVSFEHIQRLHSKDMVRDIKLVGTQTQ